MCLTVVQAANIKIANPLQEKNKFSPGIWYFGVRPENVLMTIFASFTSGSSLALEKYFPIITPESNWSSCSVKNFLITIRSSNGVSRLFRLPYISFARLCVANGLLPRHQSATSLCHIVENSETVLNTSCIALDTFSFVFWVTKHYFLHTFCWKCPSTIFSITFSLIHFNKITRFMCKCEICIINSFLDSTIQKINMSH